MPQWQENGVVGKYDTLVAGLALMEGNPTYLRYDLAVPKPERFGMADSPFSRLLYAAVGLVSGNAALLICNPFFWRAWDVFALYAVFSIVGWIFVGVPIALAFPARILSRVPWPIGLLIGATLGPVALLLVFILVYAMQGRLNEFSLAHTEGLWQLSILVSLVSFLVYTTLLRMFLFQQERSLRQ